MVRDRLASADWSTKREIICLLVKRIEVANDVVRVVFRVDQSSSAPSEARQRLPHCPTRRDHASDVVRWHGVPVDEGGSSGLRDRPIESLQKRRTTSFRTRAEDCPLRDDE